MHAPVIVLTLLVFASWPAIADLNIEQIDNATVSVSALNGGKAVKSGSGYVVAAAGSKGYVVTSSILAGGADSITVHSPTDGAQLVAQVVSVNPAIGLALLSVTGLDIHPLTFAAKAPRPGDIVWTVVNWNEQGGPAGLVRGNLRKTYLPAGDRMGYLSHDASAGPQTAGSILLNNCGQVAGFNLSGASSNGSVKALSGASLAFVLAAQKVDVPQASAACISQIAEARQQASQAAAEAKRAGQEAAKAQHIAQALAKRLQASNKQNEALLEATRAAQQRANEAINQAEVAHQNADATRADLDKKTASIVARTRTMMKRMEADNARAEARFETALKQSRDESLDHELWLSGIGLSAIVALLISFVVLRRRSALPAPRPTVLRSSNPVSERGTELHQQELTEYVLDGRDEDGIRYLLRISGDKLSDPDGVVIGRNPQDSPYIINHSDVSRKHARMRVMKDRVFIEDLGSTNGTSVNGQSIDDRGLVSVVSGDQIIIGSVVMKLRVLGA